MLSKWHVEYYIFFILRKDKYTKYPALKYKAENIPQHMSNLIAERNPTCATLDWAVPHFPKFFSQLSFKIGFWAHGGALCLCSWA